MLSACLRSKRSEVRILSGVPKPLKNQQAFQAPTSGLTCQTPCFRRIVSSYLPLNGRRCA